MYYNLRYWINVPMMILYLLYWTDLLRHTFVRSMGSSAQCIYFYCIGSKANFLFIQVIGEFFLWEN